MGKENHIKDSLVDSHIQMPKLLLKRFHNEYNRFFYYDIKGGFVGSKGTAKSMNTKYGYYSASTEHFLRDRIETPFGRILSYIEHLDFEQDRFCMTEDFEQVTKNFMYAIIARDPLVVSKMGEQGVFLQFLPVRALHDLAVRNGIAIAKEKNIFREYVLTFMVNRTDVPLVLPLAGLYDYGLNGHTIINLPISPEIALCLAHKDYAKHLIHDDGIISMFLVDRPEQLKKMNECAFLAQQKRKWGCVVCPQREELDRLAAMEEV